MAVSTSGVTKLQSSAPHVSLSKAMVKKGMNAFCRKFEQDWRSLRFFVDDLQLTGEELAGTLDGARIMVEGFV